MDALLIVLQWQNIMSMVIGLILGVMVGAIPGLTASIGISLLIPLTYGMDPIFAFAMMAGIHNGGSFGGSIPAILLRIPGTPGAICTSFDGYPLAKKGMGVQAINLAALSSAVGGTLSAFVLLLLAPPLARITLAFGPPEIFWVNTLGLCSVAVLLGKDPIKGMLAACMGLLLGSVGLDFVSGYERYTFHLLELSEGFPFLVILVGLYALPPCWNMIEEAKSEGLNSTSALMSSKAKLVIDKIKLTTAWLRSSVIGILVGLLPGVGGAASGFIAYNEVRRTSGDPESFGKGNPLGVASAEASNNADNGAAMVPALTLGIPGSGVAALMIGALTIHGMQPGPELFAEKAHFTYGYIWAMVITSIGIYFVGSGFASRLFANVLRVPPVLLMPMIVGLTFVGVYSFENTMSNVYIMFIFGLIGYVMYRFDFPFPPIVIGLVLGDKAESALRISLMLNDNNPSILFTRPISIVLYLLVLFVLLFPVYTALKERRKKSRELVTDQEQ